MTAEIGILVGVALALVVAVLITRPLRASTIAASEDDSQLSDLLARREAAYQILRDLDGDFAQGKTSEDDYRPMRVQALAQAAEIVAQLDQTTTQASLSKGAVPTSKPNAHTAKSKPAAQHPVTKDQRRLPKTKKAQRARRNEPVTTRNSACPNCSTAHAPNDAFCRKCGKVLQT